MTGGASAADAMLYAGRGAGRDVGTTVGAAAFASDRSEVAITSGLAGVSWFEPETGSVTTTLASELVVHSKRCEYWFKLLRRHALRTEVDCGTLSPR